MMAGKMETVASVPCGNTCALMGIDSYLAKSGTLTDDAFSFPLVNMKYSVSPVVRVAVKPKSASDLVRLVNGLKRLSQSDQVVQCSLESTGEHVIGCAGELHMEICLSDLKDFMGGAELDISPPVVTMRETVTSLSGVCLSKSPNNLNRIFITAQPLEEGFAEAVDKGEIKGSDEPKLRAKTICEKFKWDKDPSTARNIWTFAPDETGPNVLVNSTKGVAYLQEVRDSILAGMQWVSRVGVLCDEPMRGVRFDVMDTMLHQDRAHRGSSQIVPMTRRALYAAQLTAKPTLMEPVFLVDVTTSTSGLSGVYNVIHQRRGVVVKCDARHGGQYVVKAHLPVLESFGFTGDLRSETGGQAFPQCVFDHWQLVEGLADEEGSPANKLVRAIRTRKGLAVEVPELERFLDRL